MVPRETPQAAKAIMGDRIFKRRTVFSEFAIYRGCTIKPTRRSETARLQINIMEGDRRDTVLQMAMNTKQFPRIDISIKGAFTMQFTMTIFPRVLFVRSGLCICSSLIGLLVLVLQRFIFVKMYFCQHKFLCKSLIKLSWQSKLTFHLC